MRLRILRTDGVRDTSAGKHILHDAVRLDTPDPYSTHGENCGVGSRLLDVGTSTLSDLASFLRATLAVYYGLSDGLRWRASTEDMYLLFSWYRSAVHQDGALLGTPVANTTGVLLSRMRLIMLLLRACRPIKCLPAAVSQSQLMRLSSEATLARLPWQE